MKSGPTVPGQGASVVVGIFSLVVGNLNLRNSQCNNTFGEEATFVVGFAGGTMPGLFVEHCQFNNQNGGTASVVTQGTHISDAGGTSTSSEGIRFVDCEFNGISSGAGFALETMGLFMITARSVVVDNCQFTNIISNSPFPSSNGLMIRAGKNDPINDTVGATRTFSIRNSYFSDIISQNESRGITWAADRSGRDGVAGELINVAIENNVIQRVHSSGLQGRVAGIDITALQNLYKVTHIGFDLRLPHLNFNFLEVQQAAVLAPCLYPHFYLQSIPEKS